MNRILKAAGITAMVLLPTEAHALLVWGGDPYWATHEDPCSQTYNHREGRVLVSEFYDTKVYTVDVERGDTLGELVTLLKTQAPDVTTRKIMEQNQIENSDLIYEGTQLNYIGPRKTGMYHVCSSD